MSIHFTSMTVSQITDRAHKLMDEGTALAQLAAALVQFEEFTGRKLFVSEAEQGVSYVGTPERMTLPSFVDGEVEDDGDEAMVIEPELVQAAEAGPEAQAQPEPRPAPAVKPKTAPKPDQASATQTAAKPQPANRPWGALNLAERRIVKHLESLSQTFTAAEDLRLVELLTSGHKTPIAAAIMDVPVDQMVARWQAFMCPDVLGANGKPSIDGQKHLLAALRYRKDAANG